MRQQLVRPVARGACRVEDGDEDAQPDGAAQVMGDVDQSAGYAASFAATPAMPPVVSALSPSPWPMPKTSIGRAMPTR
jgi:hypothetical protein